MKTVIVGAGFTGRQLARELVAEGNEVVLLDSDEERVRHASDEMDCFVEEADGRNLRTLEKAGIASADAFVALSGNDEVNMMMCSLVDALYPRVSKIARVRNYSYYAAADEARRRAMAGAAGSRPLYGVDTMLNPDVEAAGAIASAVENGAVGNVVELGGGYGLAALSVGEASPLAGLSLRMLPALEEWRYLVAYVESGGEISIPNGDTVIKEGDFLGVVAPNDGIAKLLEFTRTPKTAIRRAVLFGADRIGMLLLERRKARKSPSAWLRLLGLAPSAPEMEIVVVDKDPAKCRDAVERFPGVRVLCGDVTDESLLNEENLFSSDLLVAASGNHELNLVTAAYMKSRGVKRSVALTANSSYDAIARKLGVDVAVPMRGSVVDAIMGHLRGRNVISVHSVCDRRFELVEGVIAPKASAAGKTLSEVPPGGPLVLLHRAAGDESWDIARGKTVMEPGSRVVLIAANGDSRSESRFFGKV
ncbi:MAG: NAD-binding protein [Kiritimatiellae bacterium]|nr:NAD-binding protein [Kiritimatiellia bacterium]